MVPRAYQIKLAGYAPAESQSNGTPIVANKFIDESVVLKQLKDLKTNKAMGLDKIA